MKQAKDALKKNNEDFAKLYLTSASQKKNQGNFIIMKLITTKELLSKWN